jgi:tetratricopeptide (TPR) repeat protein
MIKEWDQAIGELEQILDTTGQIAVPALAIMANIYNGPVDNTTRAIEIYRMILDRKPDSTIIGSTLLRLGAALCREKDYTEGRSVLADVRDKFARLPRMAAQAQFYYAQAYEAEDDWERALSEYQWLMENFAYTEEAFQAARHIPEKFEENGNDRLAEIWYNRAEEFYLRAARAKQGQGIEVLAYSFLAELYRITEQWEKAIEALEKIHSLVPGTQVAAKSLYNAATTAYRNMGDSIKAQGYLDQLMAEFGTADSSRIYQENETQFDMESIE